MLGVRGEVPGLAHHTLFFTEDWRRQLRADLRRRPADPRPGVVLRLHAERDRPDRRAAGRQEPLRAGPGARRRLDRAGRRGRHRRPPRRAGRRSRRSRGSPPRPGSPDLERRDRGAPHRRARPTSPRTCTPGSGGALGPAHTLRQSAFLRGTNRSRRVHGLLYAGGSSVPGIGLPMCLISAENVLKRVRGDRSSGPLAGARRRRAAPPSSTGTPDDGTRLPRRPAPLDRRMVLLDARWRLVFWRAPGASAAAVGAGTASCCCLGPRRDRLRRVLPRRLAVGDRPRCWHPSCPSRSRSSWCSSAT